MKAINTIFTVVTLAATIIGCDGGYYDADTGELVGVSEEVVGESEEELFGQCSSGEYKETRGNMANGYTTCTTEDGLETNLACFLPDKKEAEKMAKRRCEEELEEIKAWHDRRALKAKAKCESYAPECIQGAHVNSYGGECKKVELMVRHVPRRTDRRVDDRYGCTWWHQDPTKEEDCDIIMDQPSDTIHWWAEYEATFTPASNQCYPEHSLGDGSGSLGSSSTPGTHSK